MKRILLLISALVASITALWADLGYITFDYDVKIDGIFYDLDAKTNTACVTNGYKGEANETLLDAYISNYYSGDVTIPETITYNSKTYRVTGIDIYAFYNSSLASITIPNSVTSIRLDYCSWKSIIVSSGNPSYASEDGVLFNKNKTVLYKFPDRKELTSYTIPSSVTSIDYEAFRGCRRLTSITIPSSVTRIEDDAFFDCSGLTSVTWNAKNFSDFTYEYNSHYAEDCPTSPFYHIRSQITSFTIGNEVEHIPAYLCYGMSNLTKVNYLGTIDKWSEFDFKNADDNPTYYAKNLYIDGSLLTDLKISAADSIKQYAFYNCKSIKSVEIGNNVTSIGVDAFYGCSGLTKVNYLGTVDKWVEIDFEGSDSNPTNYADDLYINNELLTDVKITTADSIKNYAFCYCKSIKSVEIGNSVTSIGNYAFSRCSRLTSVSIGNNVTSIGDNAFNGCSGLTSVIWNAKNFSDFKYNYDYYSGEYHSTSPFYNIRSQITSFTIGNEVEHIPAYLCYEMSNLTKVNYLGTVDQWLKFDFKNYDDNPIYYAKNLYINGELLTELKITSANTIKKYAFYNCQNIKSVEIGNSVKSIGSSAFNGCNSLTSVTWNAKNWEDFSSSSYAPFYNIRSQITSFTIGNEVVHIPAYLCYGMSNLTKVNYLGTVDQWLKFDFKNYDDNPIYYAKNLYINGELLTDLKITSTNTIKKYVFYNCQSIKSVEIGNSVTSIGNAAFKGCSGLTDVHWYVKNYKDFSYSSDAPFYNIRSKITSFTIGNEVEHIPAYLCYEMSNLTKVNYLGTVDQWLKFDFKNYYDNPIYYAKNLYINGELLTDLKITATNTIKKYTFYNCRNIKSVEIGNSVTSIGNDAFKGCSGLTSVIWNAKKFSDFSDYDDAPFYNIRSQITSFTIGNEVEHIPAYLCYGMSKLQTITIPNSATSIGNSAFRWCSGLMSVTIPNSVTTIGNSVFSDCSKLTSITIPNSVTSIGSNAFYGCSGLTSITIPNSVTSIGTEAFSGCSGLTKINYLGTVDKWAEFDWDNSNSNPTYYTKDLYINDELLTDLKITSADSINKYAFYNCESIKSVETGNSVNLIGTEAFSGCSALTSVSIGESVTGIGSNAFKGCDKLRKVTSYPTTVPSVYENSFAHYNAALYVPCDVYDDYFYDEVWGTFKVTDCIAAQEVDAPEKVEIEVDEDNNANVIWPSTDGAKKYELEISKDGEVFCTLLFNENGQLTSIDFGNRSASVGFQFTVTGLDGASKYAYSMVAMDKKGNELQSYKGTFTTNGYVPGPDDVEDPEDPDNPDDSGDITTSATETLADANITVSNGTISADSTFSIYNTVGQNVTALNGSLQPGIYVVALDADRVKVMIK